ncbi:MAG TPA: hypothetical protein DEV81_24525 [Cyanobacteria bacterium UBA11049]|nr:hypothetical protein [Cyanobacteria bacterium UBA11049]
MIVTYEIVPDAIQKAGNSIIGFKTEEEKKQAKEIDAFLQAGNSIIGFKTEEEKKQAKLEEEKKQAKLSFRTEVSLIKKSKNEIVKNALKIVREKLKSQMAAIFLFSKDGLLERIGIEGIDKDGNFVENDWYKEESYQVGESFTGKAAQIKEGSNYGETQYIRNLDETDLKEESRRKYEEKFGSIKCAIAIPLNGRNKTYGVIQVVNKIDSTKNIPFSEALFSEDDVRWLYFLAAYIANALSNFRRDVQSGILKYLSHLLIRSNYNSHGRDRNALDEVCQQTVDLLVKNPETAFKAGILRIKNDNSHLLEVTATSISNGVTENRDNKPIKIGDGLAGRVAESGKPLILQGIRNEPQINSFTNRSWINENRFESFGCFPLLAKEDVLGTLSLYTGYNYDFYPDSIEFVQSVADLLASFVYRLKLEKIESEVKLVAAGLGAKPQYLEQTRSHFDEIELLATLENQPLNIKTLASILNKLEGHVRNLIQPLFEEGYIDAVGNCILHYIFPSLGKNRRVKTEISDSETYFLITSKGHYRLHPFISFK